MELHQFLSDEKGANFKRCFGALVFNKACVNVDAMLALEKMLRHSNFGVTVEAVASNLDSVWNEVGFAAQVVNLVSLLNTNRSVFT